MMSAKSAKSLEYLGSEKVSKLVFSFFITAFVGLMLNTIYNLTDTLFVSWGVGDLAMGGVSVVMPFTIIQGAISTTIGGGAASLVSRKLGEGKLEEAGKITFNAMIVFYITAVIITIVGFVFATPLLRLFGATDELLPYAKDYFLIILISNVFSTGFSSLIRAEGKMLYSMLIWVIPITVNIALDAIFILLLGWGVKGSAAATVISQVVGFIMCVVFFTKFSVQKFKKVKIKWELIKSILKIGFPSLIQMGSLSITIALLNMILGKNSGVLGIITFGYVARLITYAVAPFMAITQALSPIVGYNYGTGKYDRVKAVTAFCIKISVLFAIIIFLIAQLIPKYIMMIFTKDIDIIGSGVSAIRIVSIAILFTPLPMIVGAKLQAIGRTLWALIMYGSNLIFIILPVIFMGKYLGAVGVWWAYVIASILSTLTGIIKLIFDTVKNKLKNINV